MKRIPFVNGGRAGSTAILADGARNAGVGLGRAVVTFSPDTVREFNDQTSNFSAEFGQTGGGVPLSEGRALAAIIFRLPAPSITKPR